MPKYKAAGTQALPSALNPGPFQATETGRFVYAPTTFQFTRYTFTEREALLPTSPMAEAWQVPKNNSAINIEFFSERVSGVVVDRASKTVRNVCLSGLTSKKGYGYRKEALASAISQYNGASVFCDHADDNKSPRDRKLKELAGCVEKARICESSGKPYGDLKLIGPNTDWLLDLFEQSPKNVGMSHVIKGRKNKQNEIDYIESVVSVDIVAFPATTSSFSEQDNSDMELKKVK
jgi:hypothetical protein